MELPRAPRFIVTRSPIGLRGDVRPLQYVGVVGRTAAWLGLETGEAEFWVHPLEGRAGKNYEVTVRGAALSSIDGAEVVGRSGYATRVRVRVRMPASEWSSTRIAFTPSR